MMDMAYYEHKNYNYQLIFGGLTTRNMNPIYGADCHLFGWFDSSPTLTE